jgi:hypothetical protein
MNNDLYLKEFLAAKAMEQYLEYEKEMADSDTASMKKEMETCDNGVL